MILAFASEREVLETLREIGLAEHIEVTYWRDVAAASGPRAVPILFVGEGMCPSATDWVVESGWSFDYLFCAEQESLQPLIPYVGEVVSRDRLGEVLQSSMRVAGDVEFDDADLATLNIVGESARVAELRWLIKKIARHDVPVIIAGETGTGKELVARALHYGSGRRDGPFISVNCGALTEELLISELFGYEAGAFTGASKRHAGLVSQAERGTLFLDEIDALSHKAQVSLLRLLQEKEYRPLGSEKTHTSDVRVLSATNQELQSLITKRSFRTDLYYRLNVFQIDVPPLRERCDDVQVLVRHFLCKAEVQYGLKTKRFHPATIAWMSDYAWPGNVRELENFVQRAALLSAENSGIINVPFVNGVPLSYGDRRPGAAAAEAPIRNLQSAKRDLIAGFERDYIERVMRMTSGNVTQAARLAGSERRAFTRLLKKHGISREFFVDAGRQHPHS